MSSRSSTSSSNVGCRLESVFVIVVAVVSLCVVYFVFSAVNSTSGTQLDFKVLAAYRPPDHSAAAAEKNISHVSHESLVLRHPKTVDKLWIYMNNRLLIRRLAYLDKRDKDHVVLRFMSLRDRRDKRSKPSLYTKLYFKDSSSKCFNIVSWIVGSHSERPSGQDHYIHFMLTSSDLSISNQKGLQHMTIATDKDCKNETVPIDVQTIEPDAARFTYGVCLHKTLQPNVQPKTLLDWVKLNLAMGAEIITIYLQTVPEEVYSIIEPYVTEGKVEVLDWKVEKPFVDTPPHGGQTGVIAECVYYNMGRVKYLGMMDLDEFLVPQKHKKMQDMILQLEKDEKGRKAASFQFLNAFMKKPSGGWPEIERLSKTCDALSGSLPVYFNWTQSCLEPAGSLRKLIVKPPRIITAWVHHILKWKKGFTRVLEVPYSLGRSQHYRNQFLGHPSCNEPPSSLMSRYITDVTGCPV